MGERGVGRGGVERGMGVREGWSGDVRVGLGGGCAGGAEWGCGWGWVGVRVGLVEGCVGEVWRRGCGMDGEGCGGWVDV